MRSPAAERPWLASTPTPLLGSIARFGFLVFLASESMLFAGLLGAIYWYYVSGVWPV